MTMDKIHPYYSFGLVPSVSLIYSAIIFLDYFAHKTYFGVLSAIYGLGVFFASFTMVVGAVLYFKARELRLPWLVIIISALDSLVGLLALLYFLYPTLASFAS